ncbi:MAG: hypothetical protein LUH09_04370 [Clostridiales bacterium]|nr:hypothetical protein [Clostridiales bacterium]
MSEQITPTLASRKTEKKLVVFSVVLLVFALLFPLIIWDALGSGAMHFMRYGHVNVAGSSAGDSKATFFFGLTYTLSHMGPGVFIPLQLFSAQWRVVQGVTEASALADGLGMVTMALTVLVFLTPVVMIVIYSLDRRGKLPVVHKAAGIVAVVCAVIELVTVAWFGVIVVSMLSKVSNYGFRIYDFAAYGGNKLALEAVFSLILAILNIRLLLKLRTERTAA